MFHQPMSSPWRMRMFGFPCLAISISFVDGNHDLIRPRSALCLGKYSDPSRAHIVLWYITVRCFISFTKRGANPHGGCPPENLSYPLQCRARSERGEHDTGYANDSGEQQRLRDGCDAAVDPCRRQIDEAIEGLAVWGHTGESFKYIRKPLRWKKLAAHDREQGDHERGYRASLFGVLRQAHDESGQADCHQHTGRDHRGNRKWIAPFGAEEDGSRRDHHDHLGKADEQQRRKLSSQDCGRFGGGRPPPQNGPAVDLRSQRSHAGQYRKSEKQYGHRRGEEIDHSE